MLTPEQVESLAAASHAAFASGRSWQDLTDDEREANRDSVRHIPDHLRAVGMQLASPPAGARPITEFDEATLETMARLEHDRWCRYTTSLGYRHGPQRDDRLRVHPDLVAWEALDEVARDKDRDRVRAIPALVATIGLAVEPVT